LVQLRIAPARRNHPAGHRPHPARPRPHRAPPAAAPQQYVTVDALRSVRVARALIDVPKISVTWCIHDINLDSIAHDRQVLGQNGDSAFTFLIATVHDTNSGFVGLRVIAKNTRLTNQRIDQCCLAVIDVCNDSNVSVSVSTTLC
jgi:hypothetical protein